MVPFVTASLLSNCNLSTGSWRNRLALAAWASASRIGPFVCCFCCSDCTTAGGSFSVDGWSSKESQLSSEFEACPFWTRMMPFAGKRAKYSFIFRVDRVAGRNGLVLTPSLTFPAPFSIRTPSIFVSFRLGLLKDWSSSPPNKVLTRRLEVIFFDTGELEVAMDAFWARGLRPKMSENHVRNVCYTWLLTRLVGKNEGRGTTNNHLTKIKANCFFNAF